MLKMSSTIMSSASRNGSWKGAINAAIKKRTLWVRAAIAASIGMGLGR